MKIRIVVSLLLTLNSFVLYGQYYFYKGNIGKNPVELQLYSYSDGYIVGVYSYNKYQTPIGINGRILNDTMIIYENYNWNNYEAIFSFQKWNLNDEKMIGEWIHLKNKDKLEVVLNKAFKFDTYDNTAFDTLELMQDKSNKDDYFMLLLHKNSGDGVKFYGVRIYDKKTKKVKQQIELDESYDKIQFCIVEVNDYNYDGVEDFSIKFYDNKGNDPWGYCLIKKDGEYILDKTYKFQQ
ncbi:MAG: hypothetical protein AB9846_14045 [Tenuifilaceae bacterium]